MLKIISIQENPDSLRVQLHGEFTGESLLKDLHERLADLMEDPDAFLGLDPTELMVQLCKDLGLTPPEFHPPAPMVPATDAPSAANGHDSS